MPTAHRIACLRDDVVFFIYLYQRYLYPVDKTRPNEYGYVYEEQAKDEKLSEDGFRPTPQVEMQPSSSPNQVSKTNPGTAPLSVDDEASYHPPTDQGHALETQDGLRKRTVNEARKEG